MNTNKNILLADCAEHELLSLAEELHFQSSRFEIKSHIANWKRSGKISELRRYAKYFGVALLYFLKRKKFNAIAGWQQFYALIFCFYCSLFSVKKSNTVIALNFTYKEKPGKTGKVYHWFMKRCLAVKYLDYIHVLSSEYARIIHNDFGFPLERIIVSCFGINDRYSELTKLEPPAGFPRESYALAIGRSNRDYDFLIDAWQGIDFPLVIISDTYRGKIQDANITLLTNIAGEASNPWIANCGLMIIPIDDGNICSGDTVLLTSMSLERKIIVTSPSTLAEMYITDQENAILSPKNPAVFRNTVQKVLSGEYEALGANARKSFLQFFSLSSMGTKISEMLNQNAPLSKRKGALHA